MAARRGQCAGCGAPLLVQMVGRVAALNVRADATPMKAADAQALTGPNRLAWHAHRLTTGDIDLRWISRSTHPAGCLSDVIEHACRAAPIPDQPPPPRRRQAPGQDELFST